MFILDEIECFFEEIGLAVEEKISMLQDSTSWSRGSSTDEEESESEDMEDQEEDDSLDDFNEYLRECAMGMLFPFGSQDNGEHPKDEEQSAESPEKCITENIKEELEDEDFNEETEFSKACKEMIHKIWSGKDGDEHCKDEEQSAESPEKSLTESTKEELKEVIQRVLPKLPEDDKKEILHSLKNKGVSADISELLGISMESSEEDTVSMHN